jgi:hypothetical protein
MSGADRPGDSECEGPKRLSLYKLKAKQAAVLMLVSERPFLLVPVTTVERNDIRLNDV